MTRTRAITFVAATVLAINAAAQSTPPDVAALRADFHSGDPKRERQAIEQLSKAVQATLNTPGSPDSTRAAARELVDPFRPELLNDVRSPEAGIRSLAGYLLQWATPNDDIVRAFIALTDDSVPDVQATGYGGLLVAGRNSTAAQQRIVQSLDAKDPRRFDYAARVAEEWRLDSAVPALKAALGSENLAVKQSAVRALGAMGRRGQIALSALRAQLGAARQAETAQRDLAEQIEHSIQSIEGASGTPKTANGQR